MSNKYTERNDLPVENPGVDPHIERYTDFTQGRFRSSAWNKYLSTLSSYRSERRMQRVVKLTGESCISAETPAVEEEEIVVSSYGCLEQAEASLKEVKRKRR